MFDRYAVCYGDYVVARRERKIHLLPWGRFFRSVNAAKAIVLKRPDGHSTDVLWPRHYHDGEDVAAPPVVWVEKPFGGAIGLQWWSKDRYCYWIITKRELFAFKRSPLNQIAFYGEYTGKMIQDMCHSIELSKAHEGNKDHIRARHEVERKELKVFAAGLKTGFAILSAAQ